MNSHFFIFTSVFWHQVYKSAKNLILDFHIFSNEIKKKRSSVKTGVGSFGANEEEL